MRTAASTISKVVFEFETIYIKCREFDIVLESY